MYNIECVRGGGKGYMHACVERQATCSDLGGASKDRQHQNEQHPVCKGLKKTDKYVGYIPWNQVVSKGWLIEMKINR